MRKPVSTKAGLQGSETVARRWSAPAEGLTFSEWVQAAVARYTPDLTAAHDRGHAAGVTAGAATGYAQGHTDGERHGLTAGFRAGIIAGELLHAKGRRYDAAAVARGVLAQPAQRALVARVLLAEMQRAWRPLEAIRQRVTLADHLPPLTAEQSARYVQHQLQVVSVDDPVFTDAALQAGHDWAQGLRRRLNTWARTCLLAAHAAQSRIVDDAVAATAVRELQWAETVPT